MKGDSMNTVRALAAATLLAAATAAAGQTLLLDINQSIPMGGLLDNPCTVEPEAVLFQGATQLTQRVWLLPDGNLRLQVAERTNMEGVNTLASPLAPPLKYVVAADSEYDLEFDPGAFSILNFKKVNRQGVNDNFHSVLVLAFDPQKLRLELKLEGACDNGMP
jgi:hypothetical protein